MNARRTILAFVLALCTSGLLTWSISRGTKTSASPPSPRRSAVEILVARKDIAAGDILKAESVSLTEWAAPTPPPETLTDLHDAIGHVALVPLLSGEPILLRKLADATSNQGITATIPQGMRAITVRGSDVVTASSFLAPGILVDVLATPRSEGLDSHASSVLLQAVRIFAVGDRTSPITPHEATDKESVTLLVPPSEVPNLNLAMAGGRIILAIRNSTDTAREGYPAEPAASEKSIVSLGPGPSRGGRPVSVQGHSEKSFTVETVAAGKITSQSFEGDRP